MKPGAVVAVQWRDAAAVAGGYWSSIADAKAHTPCLVHTVGFLVKRTKKRLTLTQSVHAGGCGGVFSIPADWVQKIEVLQAP